MTEVIYLGHACVQLAADNGWTCIIDPYEEYYVPGVRFPVGIQADEVYCSHDHHDHNAADQVNIAAQHLCPFRCSVLEVPHDEAGGTLRGMNKVRIFESSSEKIIHFGDIGRMVTEEEIERLKNADLIMIPCGGYYTINAETAQDIITAVKPKSCLLMHYRTSDFGYDVLDSIEHIMEIIPDVEQINDSKVRVDQVSGVFTLKVNC